MDRRQFLSTVGAGAVAGTAGCTGLTERSDSTAGGRPRLGVDGRWLTDPDGTRVVLRGVTVADPLWATEHADQRGRGYWETLELALDEDVGWHSHVLRVPVRPRSIDDVGLGTILDTYLDRAVSLTRERDAYVVVAYDAVERYDTSAVDDRLTTFWGRTASRYADESHVLFDLFGAPGQPSDDDRWSWLNWRETARPWVEQIRDDAPETPIVVGSPGWNSLTRYAAEDPFDDDNVVYAFHANPSWDPDTWEESFGDAAFDVPLFATEWGYVGADEDGTRAHLIGSTSEWGEPFRDWLDAHTNVSWCAGTFDSLRQPRMFDEDWDLLGGETYMGELTREWLAATRTENWPPGRTPETEHPEAENRAPSRPQALRLTERREESLGFAWNAATDPDGDDVVQYRVRRDDDEVAVLRGSTHAVTLTDLDPDESYRVGVRAVDGHGLESPSEATMTASTLKVAQPVATIPRADEVPTMDGTLDETWSDVSVHRIENVLTPGPPDNDLGGEWRALWDEAALYYLVSVVDDDPVTVPGEVWKSDNVEIYLDPDNSRESSYDDENDAQILFERGTDAAHRGTNTFPGFVQENLVVDQTETADGWRVAVTIPWDELNTDPSVGHRLGTDVHVGDNVDGGERDAKIGWHSTNDQSWLDPSTFALVELGG